MTTDPILIVDDSVETRTWLAESLRSAGDYACLEAASLSEARAHLKAQRSQLILVDAQLDGEDGLTLLAEVGLPVPVIVTTTHRSADEMSAALDAGARDVLVKPFEVQRLASSVARALRMAKVQRERDALREQVDRQAQEFNALYTVGKNISSLLNIDEILTLVVSAAVNLIGAEQGSLLLYDEATDELYLRAQYNLSAKMAQRMRLRVTDSIIGRVVQSGRPVMLSGNDLKVQTSLLVKSLMGVPLIVGTKVIGVLTVDNQLSARAFGKHDVHLLNMLGDAAAIAIENARLFAAAEQERAKLTTILREMQDVVIVTDDHLRVLLINAAAREALQLDDTAVGQPLKKVVAVQQLLDLFEQRHSGEFVWRADITLPDGRVLQGQLSALPGVGYGAVLRDITRLKELDRIKSEFVSIVSHDLRTPLTAIRGYVSLLPRVGPLTEQQQDFVSRVERSMDSIVDLIADLLDIGKIEAGVDWEMAAVALHDVVRDVADRLQANADLHRQTFTVNVPDLPAVLGNQRRLEQVTANLIGNAIKYTPDGGRIEVSLRQDGDFLVLQVSDSGIGISLEDQRRIFDKFYRVESEATERISGTGLGLSIVKAIIKKHSGRVWVHSELGQGSTFTVLLPRYTPDKKSSA